MKTALVVMAEVATVIAVVMLLQMLILAMRNPHRSNWLRGGAVETALALLAVTVFSVATAALISGLIAAGIDVFIALGLALGLLLATALLGGRLLRLRERLRYADAGHSPFELPARSGAVPLAGAVSRATPIYRRAQGAWRRRGA